MKPPTENKQTSTDGKEIPCDTDWTNIIKKTEHVHKRSFSEKIETHQSDFDDPQDYFMAASEEFTSYDFLKWIIFVLCIVQVVYQVSYIWHSALRVMDIMSTAPSTRLINMVTQNQGWDPVLLTQFNSGARLLLALGAPIYGRFGDLYGSSLALRMALLSGVISYFLALAAYSAVFLYVSRIPLIFSHAYQGAQMVVTQITCRHHRANSLARLGFVFRGGLLIGPLLANELLLYLEPRNVLMVSFVLALICFVIINAYLPRRVIKKNDACQIHLADVFDLSHMIKLQFSCGVLLMTVIKLLASIPAIFLQLIIYQIWINHYKLSAEEQLTLVYYTSVGDIILHAFVIIVVHFIHDDSQLILLAVAQLFCSYIILAAAVQFEVLVIGSVLLAGGLVLLNLATRTILTKLVCSSDTGCVLGLYMMKDLFSSLVSPYLQKSGLVEIKTDPNWIGRLGVLTTAMVILIIVICIKPKKD